MSTGRKVYRWVDPKAHTCAKHIHTLFSFSMHAGLVWHEHCLSELLMEVMWWQVTWSSPSLPIPDPAVSSWFPWSTRAKGPCNMIDEFCQAHFCYPCILSTLIFPTISYNHYQHDCEVTEHLCHSSRRSTIFFNSHSTEFIGSGKNLSKKPGLAYSQPRTVYKELLAIQFAKIYCCIKITWWFYGSVK